MARGGIDPGQYEFPEPLLPSQMAKSASWASIGQQLTQKANGASRRCQSATSHYARSISPEKSRTYVRSQQRGLPKMVPEHIRKDFHRFGMPGDGPMGLKNMNTVCKYFEFKGYVEGGEFRAVTMAQFMQIYAYVEAKSLDWKIDVTETNFYHISTWLIQPATKATNSSLFEHIGNRQQAPSWFISHWWGEMLINVMKCMRKHYSQRGLPSHSAFWICAFANRQHELAVEFGGDHRRTNFYKAMQHAKFKVLLILDVSTGTTGPATPLKRIWCIFECSMGLDQVSTPIDTAVVVPGGGPEEVVLVCSGLTKFERTSDKYLAGRGMVAKVKREYTFPDEIVKAGLGFNIKMATANNQQDIARILNYIVGQSPDAEPPREHPKYEELNKRIRGMFAQIYYHKALARDKPTQEIPRKQFMGFLDNMSKSIAGDSWRRSLSLCLAGCRLDEDDSVQMVSQGLPPNVVNLSLNLQHTGILDRHLEVVACLLPKNLQVLSLDLSGCPDISDAGVMNFVTNLHKDVKTLVLGLQRTAVGEFLLQVTKSEPLDMLRERAAASKDGSRMADPRSQDQQSEDRQSLLECMLRSKPSKQMRDKILLDLASAGQTGDRLEMNRRREEF